MVRFFILLISVTVIGCGCSSQRSTAKKLKETYTDTILLKATTTVSNWTTSTTKNSVPWELQKLLLKKYNTVLCDGNWYDKTDANRYIQITEFGHSEKDSIGFIVGIEQNIHQFNWMILYRQFYNNVYYIYFFMWDRDDYQYTTFWEFRDFWKEELY